MAALWVLVIIGALIGGFDMANIIAARSSEISAPQQAAGAAMAIAWAAIPYVLVRAIEKAVAPELTELKRLNETLAKLMAEMADARGSSAETVNVNEIEE